MEAFPGFDVQIKLSVKRLFSAHNVRTIAPSCSVSEFPPARAERDKRRGACPPCAAAAGRVRGKPGVAVAPRLRARQRLKSRAASPRFWPRRARGRAPQAARMRARGNRARTMGRRGRRTDSTRDAAAPGSARPAETTAEQAGGRTPLPAIGLPAIFALTKYRRLFTLGSPSTQHELLTLPRHLLV